ncbi:unnamed protein product [Pieris macdunnoughi]|uniref:Uncharacterized protein n=1 Tax=Pieris macdunnoughi TaxID=345717 RepID=A0A821KZD3_9NEOP|nr:unnamed protein product [Pieris macdunnoughi]
MEICDQKPSQLLRRMRDLGREKYLTDVSTLRILWQSHLPTSVRAVLAVSETKDMDNLATVADKIMETSQQSQISEFSSPQPIRRNSQQVLDPETYDSGNTSTETLCQNDEQLWKDQDNESPNCNQSGWCYGSDINVNFDTGVKKRLNRHDEAVSDIKPALLNMSQESDLEKDKPRRKFLSFLSSLGVRDGVTCSTCSTWRTF